VEKVEICPQLSWPGPCIIVVTSLSIILIKFDVLSGSEVEVTEIRPLSLNTSIAVCPSPYINGEAAVLRDDGRRVDIVDFFNHYEMSERLQDPGQCNFQNETRFMCDFGPGPRTVLSLNSSKLLMEDFRVRICRDITFRLRYIGLYICENSLLFQCEIWRTFDKFLSERYPYICLFDE
jgi:hypothetical protein